MAADDGQSKRDRARIMLERVQRRAFYIALREARRDISFQRFVLSLLYPQVVDGDLEAASRLLWAARAVIASDVQRREKKARLSAAMRQVWQRRRAA